MKVKIKIYCNNGSVKEFFHIQECATFEEADNLILRLKQQLSDSTCNVTEPTNVDNVTFFWQLDANNFICDCWRKDNG